MGDSNNNQEHQPRKKKGSIEAPIVMLESESEEGDKVNGQSITRGMMNLITLTKKDIKTTEGKVNDACINALSDILHKKLTHKRISICHTQFFIALKERGWSEASRYIKWDPNSPSSERWQANKYTQAHINSEVLIIPCHFPGHWALAIRVIMPTGRHILHVIDSMGKDASEVTFGKVKEALKNTPIIKNKVKFKAFDIREQISDECGLRMAKYITNICMEWSDTNTVGFSSWLGRLIKKERKDTRDLNRASRDLMKGILEEESKT